MPEPRPDSPPRVRGFGRPGAREKTVASPGRSRHAGRVFVRLLRTTVLLAFGAGATGDAPAASVPWLPAPGTHAFEVERPFPPARDPDILLEAKSEFELPAQGKPVIRTFVVPCVPLGEPRFVNALRLALGDEDAVQHAVVRMDSTGTSQQRDARDRLAGFAGRPHYMSVRQPHELFAVWTPWSSQQAAPEGSAWRLHGQADLVVTCHLKPTGKPARIRPKIGLWFHGGEPDRGILTLRMANETVRLRPGTPDYSLRDSFILPARAKLHAVYPAANRVVRTFRLDVLGPRKRDEDGKLVPTEAQRVFEIPEWEPYDQEMYRFREPPELVAGTRLDLQIRYDYSLERVKSLQPISWGRRQNDEWGEVYVQFTVEKESDTLRLSNAMARHQLALNIEGNEARDENDLAAHLDLAVMYSDIGQHETAVAHGQKAVAMEPDSARAHAALGAAYLSQGFFYSAQEHLEKAVELDPEESFAWYNLGNIFYHYQVIDKAREAFQKAEALDPRDYRVANNLGTILLGDGKPEQARLRFERIVRAQPNNAPAIANLARAYELMGNTEKAVALYERAMLLSPGMSETLQPLLTNLKPEP